MIPAHSTTDATTMNARLRRLDQRGSVGARSDGGGDSGRGEVVTEISSDAGRSGERNAVSPHPWGSDLFKVRPAAVARLSEIVSLPREILGWSPMRSSRSTSCLQGAGSR